MNKENLQTVLAIVSTILAIVSVAIMIAVFLLNFSTKEDMKELKTDTNRGFSEAREDRKDIRREAHADRQEIRTDIRNLNQNFIKHLEAHNVPKDPKGE